MTAGTPPTAKQPKPLLKPEQLYRWLGVNRATVQRWIDKDPTFPVERVGGGEHRKLRRFDEDKIRAWMATNAKRPAA